MYSRLSSAEACRGEVPGLLEACEGSQRCKAAFGEHRQVLGPKWGTQWTGTQKWCIGMLSLFSAYKVDFILNSKYSLLSQNKRNQVSSLLFVLWPKHLITSSLLWLVSESRVPTLGGKTWRLRGGWGVLSVLLTCSHSGTGTHGWTQAFAFSSVQCEAPPSLWVVLSLSSLLPPRRHSQRCMSLMPSLQSNWQSEIAITVDI